MLKKKKNVNTRSLTDHAKSVKFFWVNIFQSSHIGISLLILKIRFRKPQNACKMNPNIERGNLMVFI